MWIKLDQSGNIIGHLHNERLVFPTGSASDNGYSLELSDEKLVNDSGEYIYKVVDSQLVSLSSQEILQHPVRSANKMSYIRAERNRRLTECDYIVMPDYPLQDKSAWEEYRQDLRDLPESIIDVDNVTWPVKPE